MYTFTACVQFKIRETESEGNSTEEKQPSLHHEMRRKSLLAGQVGRTTDGGSMVLEQINPARSSAAPMV
jgi:hypothetical protein